MHNKFDHALEFAWDLIAVATGGTRGCLMLMGVCPLPSERDRYQKLYRLQRRGLIITRRDGSEMKVELTASTVRRVQSFHPPTAWNRPWDGKWRVVMYDLPMHRRKDRYTLWNALTARNVGSFQQSIWIWPHDIRPMLDEIIKTTNVPECFCGFEGQQLILCDNRELVAAGWPWKEITARQERYLNHLVTSPDDARRAKSLLAIGKLARIEHQAYRHAFSLDPLLPRVLNPKSYRGYAVQERHVAFRKLLQQRVRQVAE